MNIAVTQTAHMDDIFFGITNPAWYYVNPSIPDSAGQDCLNTILAQPGMADYPRRAEFIAAFGPGGTEESRWDEADALAAAGLVPAGVIIAGFDFANTIT